MDAVRLGVAGALLCAVSLPVVAQLEAEGMPDSATQAPSVDDALDVIPVAGPQEAEAEPESSAGPRNRMIEEVVVTAQKREEALQDVPISIQAFGGEALAARGVENTYQLGQIVPGLQFTDTAGFTLIFLRGIGTDNFIPSADPSIATYIDGIYVPQGHTAAQSLGNVQRVEVLKGPQGTLFGRNATGGAISVVTEEPGDVYKANFEVEYGNFASRTAKASVTTPITDWLSASVAGLYKESENYYENVNFDIPDNRSKAFRLKLNFHPSEDFSIGLTGYRTKQTGYSTTFGSHDTNSVLGTAVGISPDPDDYVTESDLHHPADSATQAIYYGNISWSLPLLDVKLLGSHQHIRTAPAYVDFDGSAMPIAAFSANNEFSRLRTAELQFLSNEDTPFAENFKWVAGLYYYEGKAGFDPAHLRAGPGLLTSIDGIARSYGIELPQGFSNLLDGLSELLGVPATPLTDDGVMIQFAGILGTKSTSAYAQGTYYFNEWVDLTLGGRYQEEKRFLTKSETSLGIPGNNEEALRLIPFELQGQKEQNFSPKVTLTGHPRDGALVYATYGVGFKSGTYNIVNIYAPPSYLQPEKVTSYELGFKVDFFDHLMRINGAVFDNRIDNLQSGFVSLLSGGAVQFFTAGKARTRGAELDGTAMPFPEWNPGFAVSFNAAYVDAQYKNFDPCPGFREGSGLYSSNLDCSGNQIVRNPKYSGGIGIVQAAELSKGSAEIALDNYYNSGFYYDAYNTVKEDSYSVLNGRVSYLHNPWNFRVTAFVKNILAERYHVQQFQSDFGITKTLAAPREYGIRLNWDFN